jgi:hypothetical protein
MKLLDAKFCWFPQNPLEKEGSREEREFPQKPLEKEGSRQSRQATVSV